MCYNPVSSCWYAHLCFIFCFYLTLNSTAVPTAEVRLISQQGMDYCCVYHGQMFLHVFLLLPEYSSCIPGSVNCKKYDLTIISSVTQDNDHQSSNFIIYIWECDKVDRRGAKGNKDLWYCGFCGKEYNICNSTKTSMHLCRIGGHRIARCRGEILPK